MRFSGGHFVGRLSHRTETGLLWHLMSQLRPYPWPPSFLSNIISPLAKKCLEWYRIPELVLVLSSLLYDPSSTHWKFPLTGELRWKENQHGYRCF